MTYYTVKGLVKGGLPILIVTCFMAIIVGLLLGYQEETLIEYPTLLILIPVLLKIGGDTGSMLGARLTSAFHIGLSQKILNNPVVRNSVIAAIIVALVASIFVSIVVYLINLVLGYGTSIGLIFGICFIVLILNILIVYTIAVGFSALSQKIGLDPDDVVIPIVASMGDLVGVIGIMISIIIFGLAII
ncbi:MAG: magnesium transporter [Methanosarcinales archaeon]|jgi:mgtE-like transporter|nr:magnesium transporter [Methanosarcinales archaeon]